jgi:transcriptional regulator GlxA family with amidase domain
MEPLDASANASLRGWLRRLAGHGCQVGGISGGAFLLAEAGLLDGKRCTVHWEFAELFASRYPRARLVPDLFVAEEGVFTCSGGTAALDLMLHFIREHRGVEMAVAVAEQFIHPRIREHGDRQRMTPDRRYGLQHPKLAAIVERMEATLAEPLELASIAATADLSTRQVERLFRKYLGSAPATFYLELRLTHARHLLRETGKAVRAIALDCGFGSTSHFCHAYRRHYGYKPTDERKALRAATARHSLSPAVSHKSVAGKLAHA